MCITLLTQIPIHAILSSSSVVIREEVIEKGIIEELLCVTIANVERNPDK